MATTITAPVPVTHSGEVDPALYPEISVGQAIPDIVGACTTSAGNITVTISGENANCDVSFTFAATLLTYTTAGKIKYVPNAPGLYKVSVLDVTAGETVTVTIEVFGSEGV